jgi:hypothetical protein
VDDQKETSENGKKKNNNGEPGGRISLGPLGRFGQIGQTWLAFLIVMPAFILITYMLYLQHTVVDTSLVQLASKSGDLTNPNTATAITALTNFHQALNAANQNITP